MAGWWREPYKVAWVLVGVLVVWALLFDRSSGCGDDDGSTSASTVTVAPFSKIEVKGDVDLEVHAGSDAPSLKLEGDVGEVTTKVEGDTLIIDASGADDLEAVASTKELTRVTVASAGKVQLSDIDAEELTLVLNGSGKIEAAGKASKLHAEVNGSGKVDAEKLSCQDASAVVNGSGKVELAEPSELEATIRGSGKVVYGGSPEVKQTISGSGKVAHR